MADVEGDYLLSLIVNDGKADSAADTVLITAVTASALPDTGQDTCHDTSANPISCTGTGQDGEYLANPMSFTDSGDGTVTDGVTGLMWQKSDDDSNYNWYEASGTADATGNPDGAIDACGSLELGGFADWRLPDVKELASISDYGKAYPSIDATYFAGANPSYYWSSTVPADDQSQALLVFFSEGGVVRANKILRDSVFVRCVRGSISPFPALAEDTSGTVRDMATGLVWQKHDDSVRRSWDQALSYCEGLELEGQNDWRLPNAKELHSLSDYSKSSSVIDPAFFPGASTGNYWSSSNRSSSATSAWYMYSGYGILLDADKGVSNFVRCVR